MLETRIILSKIIISHGTFFALLKLEGYEAWDGPLYLVNRITAVDTELRGHLMIYFFQLFPILVIDAAAALF